MTLARPHRRLLLTLCCAPLLLLAGCPDDPTISPLDPPQKIAPNVTAPTLVAATEQSSPLAPGAAPLHSSPDAPPQAAPQSSTAPAQTPEQARRAQQVIMQAEATYISGVQNYRAGRLDDARASFDAAVDGMLSSGLDLKADGPVADEFEKLLTAINTLEIDALKQGNGFSPRLEDAPLEAATDTTFAPNPELVAKLKTELNTTSDLPLIINDQVAGYIGVFSNSTSFRAHMAASMRRLGKYRSMIEDILKQEGVPQDLIYLAVAESGFQPQVINPSGAAGMWQFMPFSGYGLTHNAYFDERFDPEKSSRAYARYIKSLYEQFGDWYLAMAAYNWGPGNIQRDVQRTGYADFWELYRRGLMPAQTRAYVPQVLAAVLMAKNPERYGLDHLTLDAPVLYDTVSTSYAIDLRLVADVTNSTVQEIVALNPALLRLSTPRDLSFDLHIPPGTKQLFNDRLKDIPEDRRASWRFHVVRAGETVETIASAFHSHASEIEETNGISAQSPMSVDDELVIPVQSVASAAASQRYKVRRGDTLLTIADRYNVSAEDLRRWNHLSSSAVKPGRTLYVAEPVRLAPSVRARGRIRGGKGRSRSGSAGSSHARGASARSSSHGAAASSSRTKSSSRKHKAAR